MKQGDGGPVYPVDGETMVRDDRGAFRPQAIKHPGMSLRDWFAGQALQGFLTSQPYREDLRSAVWRSYQAADAMLAERSKGKG